ncbi:MAG: hypothetical protein ACHP7O_09960 [Burkholderiales bacterium]
MNASIIEHSNGTSVVVVTGEDGEHRVFNIMEMDSGEEFGQIDYELFHGDMVFNYSLLGDPNADAETNADAYDCEDEYA